MAFPTTKEIEEQLNKLEKCEGTTLLPSNATLSDRVKFDICKEIILYMLDNKLTQREIAEKLGTNESRVSEIVHYKTKKVTTDKLLSYLEALKPKIQVKLAC